MTFNPTDWAKTQPHNWYSHWPRATMTKCDFCGIYLKDHHEGGVPDEANVSLNSMNAIKGGLAPALWPTTKENER